MEADLKNFGVFSQMLSKIGAYFAIHVTAIGSLIFSPSFFPARFLAFAFEFFLPADISRSRLPKLSTLNDKRLSDLVFILKGYLWEWTRVALVRLYYFSPWSGCSYSCTKSGCTCFVLTWTYWPKGWRYMISAILAICIKIGKGQNISLIIFWALGGTPMFIRMFSSPHQNFVRDIFQLSEALTHPFF